MPNAEEYKILTEKFPFFSVARCGKNEYIGIMQNADVTITSMYIFDLLKTDLEKKEFIKLGNEWWWETNRQMPINIIMGKRFEPFKYCLISFSNKDFELLYGHTISLRNLLQKKTKRKNIQLIRKT